MPLDRVTRAILPANPGRERDWLSPIFGCPRYDEGGTTKGVKGERDW